VEAGSCRLIVGWCCRLSAPSAGAKAILNTLDDAVKNSSLVGGVYDSKAIDPASRAAEHRFLVKYLAVALAGKRKPTVAPTLVRNAIVGIRILRHIGLVTVGRERRVIGQRADKQLGIAIFGNKEAPVIRFGSALHGKNVAWVLQAEAIARI